MVGTEAYRITREVPLIGIEVFCRSLQEVVAARCDSEAARVWHLYVSAECPECGIRICGDELRALAFPPSAEVASAKIGRMRLGSCARSGCEGWHYCVHFWHQEGIDWTRLIEVAERRGQDICTSTKTTSRRWFVELRYPQAGYVVRAAAMLVMVFALWLAREFYLGGRIPFLREPEKFKIETTPSDHTWPAPMDGSEGSFIRAV